MGNKIYMYKVDTLWGVWPVCAIVFDGEVKTMPITFNKESFKVTWQLLIPENLELQSA